MRPHVFEFGAQPWPERVTCLQVYAPVDLGLNRDLAVLLDQWRHAARDAPVTWLEDRWLHVTLEAVTHRPAGEVPAAERDRLAAALAEHLDGARAYRGWAGSALAYRAGVIVDVSPAAPLAALHETIRAAVHAVFGPTSTGFAVRKAHVSLGYAHGTADSDPIQRALRQVDPNGAPLHLDRVDLVEVQIDQKQKSLRWTEVARVPLAQPVSSEDLGGRCC